jgi:NAD(P)H-dependent flavin oxidoreductase YrpB (nitropropane dioxygenase family)
MPKKKVKKKSAEYYCPVPPVLRMVDSPLNKALGIQVPIMCAGMGGITGASLAAAVSEAGGIGTIGAIGLGPDGLRTEIHKIKKLTNKPYGVDLLLPQVGGAARKTNKDYTGGQLGALVDVMLEENVPLFVCAVGVPPKWVVQKLHANGTKVMNMVGAPKHAVKALEVGCDIICAQGTEAGGHTGEISTLVLVPQVVDMCKGKAIVVAAGGIYSGRQIAACMAMGAAGVWIGTRFLASDEVNIEPQYRQQVVDAESADTLRTEIFSGRPMRVVKNKHVMKWAAKPEELQRQLKNGEIPTLTDIKNHEYPPATNMTSRFGTPPGAWADRNSPGRGYTFDVDHDAIIAGQAVGGIKKVMPAAEVVAELVAELVDTLGTLPTLLKRAGAPVACARL